MKKIPRKYQYPLTVSMVSSSMLLGTSGVMAYKTLPDEASFISAWINSIEQIIPFAIMLLLVVAPTIKLLVTKILLEPEAK
ncbi:MULTISPECIES: hypothetical protein [Pseudoalteromonas]|jgi:hypothetical protein|uniref:DUF2798 domain-containing protein n=2 Tax=Pseudoalteromonas agarivorans TaxID=176102 RepID=A0AAD0U3K6_9GAMM|nr:MULTISPECIES: hypothetical protein [Pseudoalteromonas]MDY6888787.1 DUF2798 domain-containing protein [Pseudomonadota bacterium]HAG40415.1 DUF2798 domain-containing protein [Pseudoalteromonas sp.]AYM88846.1 DUF2798 domain-containing protein [Pseudoalteromonas agarivorans]KPV93467.1 hypothetical protein AN395_00593 [Pseudoalteromonas sp. P1-30]KPW02664.1 hypothetical protein AN390_02043 [Pseudoalteromonas sp. P1-11]|tara:strand:+ start:8661 stop:8903 length:243 start_codon:yes stop_codon:yes gene_type:complete